MFGIFGRKKNSLSDSNNIGKLYACLNGRIIELKDVPDPVFTQKILGDGFAVEPTSNTVLSPCEGKIIDIIDTHHAYGIEALDGAEILLHIGINTVEMKGEGFNPLIKIGDKVKLGTPICEVDFDMLRAKGYKVITPIIITNTDSFKNINIVTGNAVAGETIALMYEK